MEQTIVAFRVFVYGIAVEESVPVSQSSSHLNRIYLFDKIKCLCSCRFQKLNIKMLSFTGFLQSQNVVRGYPHPQRPRKAANMLQSCGHVNHGR